VAAPKLESQEVWRVEKNRAAPLPGTWEELRKQNSIKQRKAAQFLKCDPKTVRRLVARRELKKSRAGNIVCNEQLRNQIRRVCGDHVLP
jgi:hypothetical protein